MSARGHTPKLLSRQPPPASMQFSFNSSAGAPHPNGGRSKFSARQSPSSQSRLVCHSGNVVVISQVAPAPAKILDRAGDIGKGEMHQAVAAQDGIGGRQGIAGDVGEQVIAIDIAAPLQRRDQTGHDIDAGDAHAEVGAHDPAAVAARGIKQGAHAKPLQQNRQLGPEHGSRVAFGAETGHGFGRAPEVGVVDALEALTQGQARKRRRDQRRSADGPTPGDGWNPGSPPRLDDDLGVGFRIGKIVKGLRDTGKPDLAADQ